jgi:CIC family chloride channel protein
LLFGLLCRFLFAGRDIQSETFTVVGMAACFVGVARAPLAGIVLMTEMTGNRTIVLPMLGAYLGAMLLTALLRHSPVYDSILGHTERIHGLRTYLPPPAAPTAANPN